MRNVFSLVLLWFFGFFRFFFSLPKTVQALLSTNRDSLLALEASQSAAAATPDNAVTRSLTSGHVENSSENTTGTQVPSHGTENVKVASDAAEQGSNPLSGCSGCRSRSLSSRMKIG